MTIGGRVSRSRGRRRRGALGTQVWAGVGTLVRHPFHHSKSLVSGGAAELAALQQAPADQQRAMALAEVLIARADGDVGFGGALTAWWEQAIQIQAIGNVTNTISGGTFSGPVLQGRDFSGLTFGSPAGQPPTPPAQDPGA